MDPVRHALFVCAPDNRRYGIQRVVARRQILDVPVIAGEYNCCAIEIKLLQQTPDHCRQVENY
jgi:hypothetical protein